MTLSYCSSCKCYKDRNQFIIKSNGSKYKTCRDCLPSERRYQQRLKLESMLLEEARINPPRPLQYGTYYFDPYCDVKTIR